MTPSEPGRAAVVVAPSSGKRLARAHNTPDPHLGPTLQPPTMLRPACRDSRRHRPNRTIEEHR
ncbi:hypothetical protein [Amycolatopsis sp. WGS_07]|uniref:hypothetical protein n=1 Tax=Amycolatopsis sp. WGS_07 TaxID=3076764 RepID=UPI003872FCCD